MIRNILPLRKSHQSIDSQAAASTVAVNSSWATLTPKAMTLGLVLSLGALSGCQPGPDANEKVVSSEDKPKDENGDVALETKPSAEAQAQIDAYEEKFVAQMLSLQQRLQAEYESLQAADAAEHPETQSTTEPLAESTEATASANTPPNTAADTPAEPTTTAATATPSNNATPKADVATMITEGTEAGNPDSLSTEVGERDLTVLKKVTLEPRAPETLDAAQIKTRYRQAFAAIYQSDPLSAEEVDTFINVTTLLPDLFEEPELARQLSDKSPALARLIVQHQIWRQIEAQQVKDMQTMKIEQQQEFEALLAKFNETIEGYDEQIAKYEKMLKEFDK